MSTQFPIDTEPTACATNWYTRLACKLQRAVEPLCEKRMDFELNYYEQNHFEIDICATNSEVNFSLFNLDRTSAEWREVIEREGWAMSEGTAKMIAPRLTIWNKLGLAVWKAFSVGTTCSCCWGFRLTALAVVSFTLGIFVSKCATLS